MENKKRFIYLTINTINGKLYIGRHTGWFGDNYLGLGKELLKDIKKFGEKHFKRQILEIVNTDSELNEAEKRWVKKYNADSNPIFYNMMNGGLGGNTLKNLSSNQLKDRSDKMRKTISEYSIERKKQISNKKSIGMKRIRKDNNIESKRIQTLKKTISNKSKEEKHKEYLTRSGKNHYCAKKVKTPFGIFSCATDAAKIAEVHVQTILNRCQNKNFSDWKFL
jgi:group I intron endonuclease